MNREQLERTAVNISMIAGIFTLLVAIIMLLNYIQIQSTDPLESKTMEMLVEQMRDDPGNEALKQEIRDLDLMARKAFFNNLWQVRTGRYLLLFGTIVFLAGLRYYHSMRITIEEPSGGSVNEHVQRILSQRWILVFGGILFILAILASFAVVDHLKVYEFSAGQPPAVPEKPSSGTIEVVQVGERDRAPDETGAQDQAGSEDEGPGAIDATAPEEAAKNVSGDPSAGITPEPRWEFPSRDKIRSNYNSFRGPLGQGIAYQKNIPVKWDAPGDKNILWKVRLPKQGYNSPVIWEDRLFLSGGDAGGREVYCLDRKTGEMIWQYQVKDVPGYNGTVPQVTDDTGLSAPTVCTDGRNVYTIFATGNIIALTLEGRLVWARNLGMPNNHYGHSSSLMVWGDQVFVQYDSNSGGRVLSLSSATGETIWDKRRNANISWASPILAEIEGQYQLVLSADPIVAGYDLETGDELWSVECLMGEIGPSPAYFGGLVYAANEYARLVAIEPGTPATIVWEDDYYLPEVASPVATEGLLFIATSYGVLVCYDALTGEKYWEQEYDQGFYSSPVVAEGKLYAMDMDGVMHILRVGKTPEVIGEPVLGEKCTATPAFADGRIYLRGEEHLYCIGEKQE